MSIEEKVIKVLAAVNLRNESNKGTRDDQWIREQAEALIEQGFWNDSQIAAIVGFSRQTVSAWARSIDRESEPPQGGRLVSGALDGILELQSSVLKGTRPNDLVLQAVIGTGTSTRLISHLTEIPLGSVLYQQRKLEGTIMKTCKNCDHGKGTHTSTSVFVCTVAGCECNSFRE